MTCVMMDRDGYMWRYSPQSVNGASAYTHEIHNRRPGDGQTIDVTETPEPILEWHLGPMGKE